ncbi:MAG: hypothetical protein LAN70_12480 [Acidobacteriia bacterium]|nr:hypothetical protein [Terriglobia bacterium]
MSSGPTPAPVPDTETADAAAGRRREYVVVLGSPVGIPQIIAGALLAAFLAQCLWLAVHSPMREMELAQIERGQTLFHQHVFAAEAARSPIIPVLAAAPLIGSGIRIGEGLDNHGSETRATQTRATQNRATRFPGATPFFYPHPRSWRWRARLPFIAIGVLLGASLWYVARRLYGNAGGYIALALYAFSPAIIMRAAAIQPAIVAAWGAFGMVFTAIAVSHTLYAPREVVLWNWKRIGLLGLAMALAVGSHLALAAVALLALGFMLYLVPERTGAAGAIVAVACAVALVLLLAAYGFDVPAMAAAVRGLRAADFAPRLLGRKLTYNLLAVFFLRMPGVLAALAVALIGYAVWKRPRFFGVTAPLVSFGVLIVLGITMPHLGGYDLFVASLPFAFVFIAGVFADLLETSYGSLVTGILTGILAAHAAFSVAGLARIS